MIYRFLHFLGFALWLGGGWATMAMAIAARRESAEARRILARVLPAASSVVATGTALTLFGGLALAVTLANAGAGHTLATPGRMLMMGAGVLAALLVFTVNLPASFTLARLASQPGELSPDFERVRVRQAITASVSGVLGLLALVGATLL